MFWKQESHLPVNLVNVTWGAWKYIASWRTFDVSRDNGCLVLQISVWIKRKLKRVSRRLQSTLKRWDINHSNSSPLVGQLPSAKFFLHQISQTNYWFSMPWSIPGCDATWSVSALQESMVMFWCILICAQSQRELSYVQPPLIQFCI